MYLFKVSVDNLAVLLSTGNMYHQIIDDSEEVTGYNAEESGSDLILVFVWMD
jgi:hypothetical protein